MLETDPIGRWLGRLSPTWQPVSELSERDSQSLYEVVALGLAEYRRETVFSRAGDSRKITVISDVSGDFEHQLAAELADILCASAPWELENVVATKNYLSVRLTAAGEARSFDHIGTEVEDGIPCAYAAGSVVISSIATDVAPSSVPDGREQRANSASASKIFPKGLPSNQDVIDLAFRIHESSGSGKSLNQIAREFCGFDTDGRAKADALLSQLRRMKREGRWSR